MKLFSKLRTNSGAFLNLSKYGIANLTQGDATFTERFIAIQKEALAGGGPERIKKHHD
jgi:hypothetical protein